METYVLILWLTAYNHVGGVTTQEFSSEATCEAAGKRLSEIDKTAQFNVPRWLCVKK